MQFCPIPENGKCIAAQAVTGRFDDRKSYGGGKCGINCVTTLKQHPEPSLCGQRLRRRNDVVRKQGAAMGDIGGVEFHAVILTG